MGPDDATAPTQSAQASSDSRQVDPITGATIAGRYRVLTRIGEGGFGLVYEAEQTTPVRRRVAIKILKPGMDSKSILARFEAERQALALMDHPSIAKVFDAGQTDRGTPYFVMELVRGSPITEYCDKHRLTIEQRLILFASVCDAIQHAHTKAIIHRDIKPSNVLIEAVGESPRAKVIDFGIAKAMAQKLTERTLFTERGQIIGTPEYMSPEQAEMSGEDIDTRSDVYSLGVLLYELLAGQRPFDLRKAALVEMQRVIREVDPPKPSTRLTDARGTGTRTAECRRTDIRSLAGRLKRELEWIPLRALRKDRSERYRTAADLADDVRRYLNGEALDAGPETTTYRLRKLIRRNKGPFSAISAIFATLLLGVAGTGIGFVNADREAQAARHAEKEQAKLADEARRERDVADAARKQVTYDSYVSNIQMAEAYLNMRQFQRAPERLEATPPQLRGWEWHWLNARSDNSFATLKRPEHKDDWAMAAAFSPDGKRVVTGFADCAWISDAITGYPIIELGAHPLPVSHVSFSPDGSQVATASWDKKVRVWSTETGTLLAETPRHEGTVRSVCFSPDGSRIATASHDCTARVFDASDGMPITEPIGSDGHVLAVSFSSGGEQVAIASSNSVQAWSTTTGRVISHLAPQRLGISFASFSRDGSYVLTVSYDRTAQVWNTTTGTLITSLVENADSVTSAAFSPDGMHIVTASPDGQAKVWDTTTGTPVANLRGHNDRVTSIAFSPNGTRVVTASADRSARVWEVETGAFVTELVGHQQTVSLATFSPDGSRLVTTAFNEPALLWNLTSDSPVSKLPVQRAALDGLWNFYNTGEVSYAANGTLIAELYDGNRNKSNLSFSPDGKLAVVSARDGTAHVWDVLSGTSIAELQGHQDRVRPVSFSSDNTRVVTFGEDGTARVWDVENGSLLATLQGHGDWVSSASFSPDGTRVVTTCEDGTARVWDAATSVSLVELRGHRARVRSASFSRDGTRVVTWSNDGSARVWDASTGASLAELNANKYQRQIPSVDPDIRRSPTASGYMAIHERSGSESKHWVRSGSFSPDGMRVGTAAGETAWVWDVMTGTQIAELSGHEGTIDSISFSPDGTRVVTASWDETARVWDATTGVALVELRGHEGKIFSASFSNDGTQVVTNSEDGTTRVWDAAPSSVRYAQQIARERGEDTQAILQDWMKESGFNAPPAGPPPQRDVSPEQG